MEKSVNSLISLIFIWGPMLITIPYRGFVFKKLWDWFLTPVFGIDSPNIIMCAGLFSIISFATTQIKLKEIKENSQTFEDSVFMFFMTILYYTLFLIVSYLVHFFSV